MMRQDDEPRLINVVESISYTRRRVKLVSSRGQTLKEGIGEQ